MICPIRLRLTIEQGSASGCAVMRVVVGGAGTGGSCARRRGRHMMRYPKTPNRTESVCVCMCAYVCVCARMCARMCVCVCARMCVCVCVCGNGDLIGVADVPASKPSPSVDKYDWTESNIYVYITAYVPNDEDSRVIIDSNSVGIRCKDRDNWDLNLPHPIIVCESSSNIRRGKKKIEITLKKAEENTRWNNLTMQERAHTDVAKKSTIPWKKDWNKIGQDIEDDKEPSGDGGNEFLRRIYADGDEEARRAMVKSFQTSGGTVLSTNWDSVKGTDYGKQIQPPDGMEVKTWNQ
eukprot:GHVO01038542.1.p1 GENE.GHVO01038542.1~~GHVO01038542.1.p1  ORF type:complete len:293 (+),score=55.57 GHVO01038542.1:153-1031(+)